MKTELKLLLLEDEISDAELIQKSLRRAGLVFKATIVSDKPEFAAALLKYTFDVILADNSLPQFNSAEALKFLHEQDIDSPFILVTGMVSEEFAVDIIHQGADDYILKNNLTRLPSSIARAIEKRKTKKEKLKTEAALIQSEKRYRTLFQRNLAGIYESTIEGKIIDCNYSFCKMLGYNSSAELRKIPARNLYFSDMDRSRTMSRLKNEEFLFNYEALLRRKDGEPLYVIENISLIDNMDTGGQTIEGIMIDITQRKQAEENLRKSEEKYRLLFDENPLPAWVTDNQAKIFLAVNDAAVRHYGYSHDEFIGMPVTKIQPLIDIKGLTGIAIHIKKDGTAIDAEVVSTIISYEGRSACLVLVNDLTQKLKAENEIREVNRELHELSLHLQNIREEERIQIARDIHDELGQQLTGLKMDVYALDKLVKSDDIAVRGRFTDILVLVEEIVKSVRKIAANLRPHILDDLGLVAALKWQSQEIESRFGITINFVCDLPEIDTPPVGISTGLFRIYQEALTNAVRHANAHVIDSSLKIVANRIILEIKDDGKGIDTAGVPKKKSFGLLGIKERVFVMDGEYTLKSGPGEGTCLTISVPL
jgi:PAS domain S-box-containing protein